MFSLRKSSSSFRIIHGNVPLHALRAIGARNFRLPGTENPSTDPAMGEKVDSAYTDAVRHALNSSHSVPNADKKQTIVEKVKEALEVPLDAYAEAAAEGIKLRREVEDGEGIPYAAYGGKPEGNVVEDEDTLHASAEVRGALKGQWGSRGNGKYTSSEHKPQTQKQSDEATSGTDITEDHYADLPVYPPKDDEVNTTHAATGKAYKISDKVPLEDIGKIEIDAEGPGIAGVVIEDGQLTGKDRL